MDNCKSSPYALCYQTQLFHSFVKNNQWKKAEHSLKKEGKLHFHNITLIDKNNESKSLLLPISKSEALDIINSLISSNEIGCTQCEGDYMCKEENLICISCGNKISLLEAYIKIRAPAFNSVLENYLK